MTPHARRLAELRSRADKAVEGMHRARIDQNGVLLELHRRDYVAAVVESKRLLDAEGRLLHRQAGQLAAASAALVPVACAAAWWDWDRGRWTCVVALAAAGALVVVSATALALRRKLAAALET